MLTVCDQLQVRSGRFVAVMIEAGRMLGVWWYFVIYLQFNVDSMRPCIH